MLSVRFWTSWPRHDARRGRGGEETDANGTPPRDVALATGPEGGCRHQSPRPRSLWRRRVRGQRTDSPLTCYRIGDPDGTYPADDTEGAPLPWAMGHPRAQYLISPQHPDARVITYNLPEPVWWDDRLFG